jgi:hypothetical protein
MNLFRSVEPLAVRFDCGTVHWFTGRGDCERPVKFQDSIQCGGIAGFIEIAHAQHAVGREVNGLYIARADPARLDAAHRNAPLAAYNLRARTLEFRIISR